MLTNSNSFNRINGNGISIGFDRFDLRKKSGLVTHLTETPNLVLDKNPNASCAFSLRKLSSTYNGKCINVRRSSDNSSMDIGFVNNVLDTVSMINFVGSGSGYVAKWYDQSGNNYNVSQTTATYQPTIILSGSLETINTFGGKKIPKIKFGLNANVSLNNSGALYSNTGTTRFISTVVNIDSFASYNCIWGGANGNITFSLNCQPTGVLYYYNPSSNYTLSPAYSSNTIFHSTAIDTNITVNNGLCNGAFPAPNGLTALFLSNTSAYPFIGGYYEFIVWGKELSGSTTQINKDINNYYGIY